MQPELLLARIASRDYTVGIMGMGYVGLPLAIAAIKAGFRVIGFDIDGARIALINRGESGIKHIPSALIAVALSEGRLRATAKLEELGEPDAILIPVRTPLSKQREPDLTFVDNSARAVAKALRPGQLVILELTTWPGTTREVMRPILENSGSAKLLGALACLNNEQPARSRRMNRTALLL